MSALNVDCDVVRFAGGELTLLTITGRAHVVQIDRGRNLAWDDQPEVDNGRDLKNNVRRYLEHCCEIRD